MDIVECIKSQLECHICPIYTPADAERDCARFMIALGFKVIPKPKAHDILFYSTHGLSSLLHTSRSQCERNSLPCKESKKGNVSGFIGPPLRNHIMKQHNNNVSAWLAKICAVPQSFARLFLPLPHDKPVPDMQMKNIWKALKHTSFMTELCESDQKHFLKLCMKKKYSQCNITDTLNLEISE